MTRAVKGLAGECEVLFAAKLSIYIVSGLAVEDIKIAMTTYLCVMK